MTLAPNNARSLEREHPEWRPWIAVVKTALREAEEPWWEQWVPARNGAAAPGVPQLSGAQINVDGHLLERWSTRLFDGARRSGAANLAHLTLEGRVDWRAIFAAALRCDEARLREIASAQETDGGAFAAVAMLLPVPFLQACNRRWAAVPTAGWNAGYCPTCGAWPAFAEVRGIERTRYLRCGRCGSEWESYCLSCPYCGVTDHHELASLIAEGGSAKWIIEACSRCGGYVKTFTTLRGAAPLEVILEDLASVELDLAAAEQGYKRPAGAGYTIGAASAPSRSPV
jgi:FdhE protein